MLRNTVEPFEVDVNGRVVACECCVFGSTDCGVYTVGVRLADSGEALGTGVWDVAHDLTPWGMLHLSLALLYAGVNKTFEYSRAYGVDATANLVPMSARIAVTQAARRALDRVGAMQGA